MLSMDLPMLDYVLMRLDASKGRLPSIAADTGISYRTLQKISLREVTNPGVQHVQTLYDYFRRIETATA